MDLFTDVCSFAWQVNELNFYILALTVIVLHSQPPGAQSQRGEGKGGSGGVDTAIQRAHGGAGSN